MLKQLFCLFAIASIVGCAGKSLKEEDIAKIKKVAVYSMLGNKANHRYMGTTVFSNNDETFDASGWKVDELTTQAMRKALSENSSIAKIENLKGSFGSIEIKPGWQEPLVKQAKAQGADTLIVIVPASYTNAAQFPPGYGLFRRSAFGITNTNAYMLAQVQIFNTSTGELSGWRFTYDEVGGKPNLVSAEKVPWKDKSAEYSKAEMAEIQKVLTNHISNGAVYALSAMKLTPAKYKK